MQCNFHRQVHNYLHVFAVCQSCFNDFESLQLIISNAACLFYDHAMTFGMHITDFIPDITHSKHSARSRDRLPMEETQDPQLVLVFRESVSGVLWQHSGYCARFHDAINSGMCFHPLQ
jgi:hypothetical protein